MPWTPCPTEQAQTYPRCDCREASCQTPVPNSCLGTQSETAPCNRTRLGQIPHCQQNTPVFGAFLSSWDILFNFPWLYTGNATSHCAGSVRPRAPAQHLPLTCVCNIPTLTHRIPAWSVGEGNRMGLLILFVHEEWVWGYRAAQRHVCTYPKHMSSLTHRISISE